jgi:ribosomal protein S18 acetylase RimI-like enzyme
MQIRHAILSDLDPLASLFDAYRQFYDQKPDRALARDFIRARLANGESVILLAEDAQGAVLGFCQMYPSFCSVAAARIVVLYDLFVAPAARQSGAGRALMQAAQVYAQDQGFARMDLTTAKTNVKAQSLYRALGWTRDEVFEAYSLQVGKNPSTDR